MPQQDFWPQTLMRLASRDSLSADQAAEAMRQIMGGEATAGQIGGFLMALRTKGETVDEMDGLARTMLEFATPVRASMPVVDVVGTGGDRAGTFNISTVSAIVVAGAGVAVAKHGNRAASSHCGSADVLETLGVKIDLGAAAAERCIAEAGITFLFAPVFHPAMAHAGPVRRELRVPTVFNFLGPLTNPARPFAQAVGVSDPRMLPLMAEVLGRRGIDAVLFHGEDGLDELTTTGPSTVIQTRHGELQKRILDPAEVGIPLARAEDLKGGDAAHNADIVRRVLAGERGARRDVVLLNAAAALEVAGRAPTLSDAVVVAAESIDSGAAAATLESWASVSQRVAG